jgi:hypothetical protein
MRRAWTWDEFTALPAEDVTVDIHCVTKWSKLDTRMKGVETEADWVTAFADGDYTTNIGLRPGPKGRRGSPASSTMRRWTPSTAGWAQACGRSERTGRCTMRLKRPARLGCTGLAFEQLDLASTPTPACANASGTPRRRRSSSPSASSTRSTSSRWRRSGGEGAGGIVAARPDGRRALRLPGARGVRRPGLGFRRAPVDVDRSRGSGVPAPTLTTALYSRFGSRGLDIFADKLLSAMRNELGGHAEKQP